MASISRRGSKTKAVGATPEGREELVGFTEGARESTQDWRDLLLDLKRRGLDAPPRLADGALGFWKVAGEVWPRTREQRCWSGLQEIWMAEIKAAAELGVAVEGPSEGDRGQF